MASAAGVSRVPGILTQNLESVAPRSTEMYKYELYSSSEEVAKLPKEPLLLDDGSYHDFKLSRPFDKDDKPFRLFRRQFSLNIVGYNKYKQSDANFDYCPNGKRFSPIESDLPPSLQRSINDFFGFLVYEYEFTKPREVTIIHYPSGTPDGHKITAYFENYIRLENQVNRIHEGCNGYTLDFMQYNPNECIFRGIEEAIRKGEIEVSSQDYIVNCYGDRAYRGLYGYREISIEHPSKNLKLRKIEIDPDNSYGVKTVQDLVKYIRGNSTVRATGTTGSTTSIQHMPLGEEVLDTLVRRYATQTYLEGEDLLSIIQSDAT